MSELEIHESWEELDPAEGFDTRTFVTKQKQENGVFARGHVSYYDSSHTVESALDGHYNFEYPDTEKEAYQTIESEMSRIASELVQE